LLPFDVAPRPNDPGRAHERPTGFLRNASVEFQRRSAPSS
jgi:hypothetical protein